MLKWFFKYILIGYKKKLPAIFSYTFSIRIASCLLLLTLTSCDENPVNSNQFRPCPTIVPISPYDVPVWHPSGDFIGFNYVPLRGITFPYEGCPHLGRYEFNSDSSGFWLINIDGTNQRRILPHTLLRPAWSPDGDWIAFVVHLGGERHIFKMRFTGEEFDTTSIEQLTFNGRNFFPSWSPDGEWIAYDSNVDSHNGMYFIWIMKSDGTQKRRIAYDPTKGEIRMPDWSKTTDKILHVRYSTAFSRTEVFEMDLFGSNVRRLTNNSKRDINPKYVFDFRQKIVFWSDGNLWIMDSSGTNPKQLSNQSIDNIFSVSPSGNKIVYTIYNNTWTYENGTLWIINLISGGKRQLTFNQNPNN